jgi:ribosomal protein S13
MMMMIILQKKKKKSTRKQRRRMLSKNAKNLNMKILRLFGVGNFNIKKIFSKIGFNKKLKIRNVKNKSFNKIVKITERLLCGTQLKSCLRSGIQFLNNLRNYRSIQNKHRYIIKKNKEVRKLKKTKKNKTVKLSKN